MSELLPQSISEAALLDLAVTCRVLTRDIVTAAFGVSYDAASRCLERLSRPARPYLARLRRRPIGAGRRTAMWYTLRPAGLQRLLALGTDAPADDLRATLRRIERLRWDAVHGPATDLGRIERAAMLTALFVGAALNEESPSQGLLAVDDAAPGAELDLHASGDDLPNVLVRERGVLPSGAWDPFPEYPIVPTLSLRVRSQTAGVTHHVVLLVFIHDASDEASRRRLLDAVARACAVAPGMELSNGPDRTGARTPVRIIVWCRTLAEETAFVHRASETIAPVLWRVWSTNGEVVPLEAAGPKRIRVNGLWAASRMIVDGAWFPAAGGKDRKALSAILTADDVQLPARTLGATPRDRGRLRDQSATPDPRTAHVL